MLVLITVIDNTDICLKLVLLYTIEQNYSKNEDSKTFANNVKSGDGQDHLIKPLLSLLYNELLVVKQLVIMIAIILVIMFAITFVVVVGILVAKLLQRWRAQSLVSAVDYRKAATSYFDRTVNLDQQQLVVRFARVAAVETEHCLFTHG